MRLDRKKNAVRNIKIGFLNKIVTILCPFVLRTVIIKTLGTEYLGLSSLFKSVLQVLSLSELGIGSAMVFNMYKPIAESDEKTQSALLVLYKKVYMIIGSVILFGGLLILPFIKLFIHGDAPNDINIYALYLIYIFNSSESYFVAAYQSTVLSAYQRRDIIQKIGLSANTILYVVQIICLLYFKNYYLYVIWLPIFTLIENIATARYVKKNYPNLFLKNVKAVPGDLKRLLGQVRDLFGHKLSNVVTNSVDTIVISTFLGLSTVTVYNNYFYLLSAVNGVLHIIYQAILAGIGNSLELETKEKNKNDFLSLLYTNSWLVGWCAICFLCLYQPMMILWMGKDLLLDYSSVILLAIYFFVWKMRQPILTYKDASGMWSVDRMRPYIEIVVNLSVNIILVQIIGLNGIIISTILSMAFVSFPWEGFAYTKESGVVKYFEYISICLKNTGISFLIAIITYFCCSMFHMDILSLFLFRIIVCIIVPNILYYMFYKNNKYVMRIIQVLKTKILITGRKK